MLHRKLFHGLRDRNWGYINLNAFAVLVKKLTEPDFDPSDPKPAVATPNKFFSDTEFATGVINSLNGIFALDHTHGGYLEDRSDLWEGIYLPQGHMVHLGIDYQVPEGTPVNCPCDVEVIDSWADPDMNGGWGGRLILRTTNHRWAKQYFILGHLKKEQLPPVGTIVKAGDVIAIVAGQADNGGWAIPHLHFQMISEEKLNSFGDWKVIDGYAAYSKTIGEDYPNPESLTYQKE